MSYRLVWKKPASASTTGARPLGLAPPVAPSPFAELLADSGIPRIEGAETPLEEATILLKVAAEAEHTLMVQYLYSALSISDQIVAGTNVFEKLNHIAIEEMGHLVAVQNLLISLQGPDGVYFGRDTLRGSTEEVVVPLIFEPLDLAVLARYITAERPSLDKVEDQALKARLIELEELANAASGLSSTRVGALYLAIYWIFQPTDQPFGRIRLDTSLGFQAGWHLSSEDFQGNSSFQSDIEEWRGFPGLIVPVIENIEDACNAIADISEQGEGFGSADDSHFEEFLQILGFFESGALNPTSLPKNPFISALPSVPSNGEEIIDSYTSSWCHLFCLRYQLLLVDLTRALKRDRSDPVREKLIDLVFKNMLGSIKKGASHIVTRPQPAAPTFQLLSDELPRHDEGLRLFSLELLDKQNSVIQEIQADEAFEDDFIGGLIVGAVANEDQTRSN